MVDSIQGFGAMQGIGTFPSNEPLTDDQKSEVQSILSKYDPKNLTADDAKAIFKAFREAGIQPGSDLTQAIKADGFDPTQLRSLARPGGHHHHTQGGDQDSTSQTSESNGICTSALQTLQGILSQYDLTNLSSDDQTSLIQQLNSSGLMSSGNTIDLSA